MHSSDEESEGGEGSSGDEQLEEDRRRQRAVLEKDKVYREDIISMVEAVTYALVCTNCTKGFA